MSEADRFYEQQLKKIAALKPYRYKVVRYTVGHAQLVIVFQAKKSRPNSPQRLLVLFEGVKYLQMFSSWQDAPFERASPSERDFYLEQLGIDAEKLSYSPLVFSTPSQGREMLIVCARMLIVDKLPELYEYTW